MDEWMNYGNSIGGDYRALILKSSTSYTNYSQFLLNKEYIMNTDLSL